jgi:dihydropteroate synthase
MESWLALAKIGRVKVIGKRGSHHIKVMGIINASPESFFKGSIKVDSDEIAQTAKEMQNNGAHIIDIGAMSTAPYLDTIISVEEEIRRLKTAIDAVKSACDLPISVDTPRAAVADAASKLGVDAINDVTGLKYDQKMAQVAARSRLPLIIGAYSKTSASGRTAGTVRALKESISIAGKAGIQKGTIIVDPSIGFFRSEGKNPFFTKMTDMPWYCRDLEVLSNLSRLTALAPVCISISRKSFIGHLLNMPTPEERVIPSIACEVIAALNGASLVRTHNVKETVQALTMLELLLRR